MIQEVDFDGVMIFLIGFLILFKMVRFFLLKLFNLKRNWDYNWDWIKLIWIQRKRAKENPLRFWQAEISDCLKATIALTLNRWYFENQRQTGFCLEDLYMNEYPEIAWQDVGNYSTDYGVGYAWISLHLMPGCKVLITENSSL